MMRRSSRWIAGLTLGLLIVAASNHAVLAQSKVKWETTRVTEPEGTAPSYSARMDFNDLLV